MSLIRSGSPMFIVDGFSKDYVFVSSGKAKDGSDDFVEDYGKVTKEGLIEILHRRWGTDDELVKNYIIKKLAEKLDVKLRDKPLTEEEWLELHEKKMKEFEKEWQKHDKE